MDNKDGTEDNVHAEILFIEENPGTHPTIVLTSSFVSVIQGADDKLGQFLSQDIWATANHRNCLKHSLESCPLSCSDF
jgi:hypothetical protein